MLKTHIQFPDAYWSAPSALLYLGDVVAQLRRLPTRSVQTCITSPPYWGLRDYGTAQWEGGNPDCEHEGKRKEGRDVTTYNNSGNYSNLYIDRIQRDGGNNSPQFGSKCIKCGATKIDMQIGSEPSPDCMTYGQSQCGMCFICTMVKVFREVHRVLRDDGTCWINLGDGYSHSGGHSGQGETSQRKGRSMVPELNSTTSSRGSSIPQGNLLGIPWRVALALQVDGWIIRNDNIWYSPNKMPESVTSRCSKSHEHIFMLTKSMNYYYDSVAIEEDAQNWGTRDRSNFRSGTNDPLLKYHGLKGKANEEEPSKNKRDVWVVPSLPKPKGLEGHFATFSPQLITPCILAGTSEHGCCAECATPYERVVRKVGGIKQEENDYKRDRSFRHSRNGKDSTLDTQRYKKETVTWQKKCGCQTTKVVPCIVLDPFVGSGTTVATAIDLERQGIGIDLSEEYLTTNAIIRIEASIKKEKIQRKPTTGTMPYKPLPRKPMRE